MENMSPIPDHSLKVKDWILQALENMFECNELIIFPAIECNELIIFFWISNLDTRILIASQFLCKLRPTFFMELLKHWQLEILPAKVIVIDTKQQ